MEESQYTRAKAHSIPEPGPTTTTSERLLSNIDPGEVARQNMNALRRS